MELGIRALILQSVALNEVSNSTLWEDDNSREAI